MARNMSFALTLPQLLDGSKTVTRRCGWKNLKAGDIVRAVNKSMGFTKGERPVVYGTCEILAVRREHLNDITQDDVRREGFTGLNCHEFIRMFCQHMKCQPITSVTRIEFRFTATPGESDSAGVPE